MRLGLGLLFFAIGCGPAVVVTEVDGDTEAPPPGPMTSPPTPGTSTTSPPPPPVSTSNPPDATDTLPPVDTSSGEESDPSFDGGFLDGCCDDWGFRPYECDLFAQDCPEGEKCMPWANDGGNDWNATRCTPLAADPDLVGDPCVVEGSGVSGVDSCELGAMCFFVDDKTNGGSCVALCAGDPDNPSCDGITTCVTNEEGALAVCVEECDPTAEGCSTGNQCAPGLSRFVCTPYPSGPGAYGAACGPFECASGLTCQDPASVSPSCDALETGCCTTYCDTDGAPCPEAGQSCEPYYPVGEAAEGYEHIGVCLTA